MRFDKSFFRRNNNSPKTVVVDTNFLLGQMVVETACNDGRYKCVIPPKVAKEAEQFTGKSRLQININVFEPGKRDLEEVRRKCYAEWEKLDPADREVLALALAFGGIVASDDDDVNICAKKLGLKTVKLPDNRPRGWGGQRYYKR